MIVDHRTYELQSGRLREFLASYEKEGLLVHLEHLGGWWSWFASKAGNVNATCGQRS
jgi:hypothetical protein